MIIAVIYATFAVAKRKPEKKFRVVLLDYFESTLYSLRLAFFGNLVVMLQQRQAPLVSSPVFPCLPFINRQKGRVHDVTYCYNLEKNASLHIN